ncbi:MAG: hypothetical protein J7L15_00035 [Clostridiales bacterium]|nr:hypothetical protein [Clostridiales bacterium]
MQLVGNTFHYKDATSDFVFMVFGKSHNDAKLDIIIRNEGEPILYKVTKNEIMINIKNNRLTKVSTELEEKGC